jgi:hypothetical protein
MRNLHVVFVAVLALAFTAQAKTPSAFDAFAGKWSGNLEYQDYQNAARRVKIPVKLSVTPRDATSAIWDFKYDDFGKVVTSFETHSWVNGKYSVTTKGQAQIQSYSSSDFEGIGKAGSGKAILTGSEIEVGRKVEIRRTITLTASNLTTLTETHPNGEAFKFRNQSTYVRQP